ncbi:hypothetical protein PTSG_09513 [Salpingoeca rosetta]|uniref:Uncharacterized protein n=1 Tax=Salpingoeca rosetta (strain ATCC 50818 / BSB-021) TaxID=946362 RepID=F2UL80_SALR5|nr:uncharacterized protein PTSG_09513 [Salpingoeca rosetta]EGD77879.1 hypothetical protein PTSG_09513 [Salpingoeca rosetta]|eukprot:XP_004989943.1 hypothetical protein PTSG_09513 [Salpingoeca rosetta]
MSAPMPPPPSPAAATGAPQAQAQPEQPAAQQEAAPARSGPGSFDSLHNEIRGVLPAFMVFQGARFAFQKPVGQHLALTHSIILNGKESAYKLQPTYIGTMRQKSPQESFPICIGEVDHAGRLMANIIHEATDNIKLKYQLQTDGSDVVGTALETEFAGSDFSAGLKMLNVNPAKNKGTWILNYLQRVTSRFSLGAELQYQYMANLTEYSGLNFGGKYQTPDWLLAVTASPVGIMQASYVHQIAKNTTAGCELEMHLPQRQVQASVGVQYSFKNSTFRGQITSGGVVMGYFEKQLVPAFTFIVSAILDHVKSETVFGLGLQIGQ